MNKKEKDIIISIMVTGMASGVYTIWEAYFNYTDFLPQITHINNVEKELRRIDSAMAKFLQKTASYPEDPIHNIKPEEVYGYMLKLQKRYIDSMEKWCRRKQWK